MQDTDWLMQGTIFYKRDKERNFTVIPTSSIVIGGFNPRRMVESYYMDREKVTTAAETVCKNLGYKPELFWQRGVRYKHREVDEREPTFLVKSYSEDNALHEVTLRNTALRSDDFDTMLTFFKNQKHSCTCGRGTETDQICSMPYEACKPWGITRREWEESHKTSKIYGEIICNHTSEALIKHGVYPMFDEARIVILLPDIMDAIMKLQSFNKKELDVNLGWVRDKLGLWSVVRTFLEQYREKQKEETTRISRRALETELYSMPKVRRY